MAVLERSYKRFQGPLSPEWSRFLIIPRHAYRHVFRSKLFTAFFVVCFLPLLVEAILIYLHHNTEALGILKVQLRNLLPIDAAFFEAFVDIHCFCSRHISRASVGLPIMSGSRARFF